MCKMNLNKLLNEDGKEKKLDYICDVGLEINILV